MAKFKYHEGVGRATLTVNGEKKYVEHGDVIEIHKDDPVYSDILMNRKWKLLDEHDANQSEPFLVTIENLVAIKGVGKASAEKLIKALNIPNGGFATWNNIIDKGEQWIKDLLPDDIASDIWNEAKKRGGQ